MRKLLRSSRAAGLLLLALLLAVPAEPAGAQVRGTKRSPVGFLSGPRPDRPRDVARGFLRDRRAALGVSQEELADLVVRREFTSRHNGVTHVYLRQRLRGLPVLNGEANVAVDRVGRVLHLGDRLARRTAGRIRPERPERTAREALAAAVAHLGLVPEGPPRLEGRPGGLVRKALFSQPGVSLDEIPVSLGYYRMPDDTLRLAWDLVLRPPGGRHWWNLRVDAEDGRVLDEHDWVDAASYEVFPLPVENPNLGTRSVVVDPADPVASPFGWLDTDGVPGAERTFTRGNNVRAQDDRDANDAGGIAPDGGAGLAFQFPLDLAQDPEDSLEASVVNLFYWNNLLHDLHYQYGFDEAAGNFQSNNYGRGGLASDSVVADALDGGGFDNANFATPPDGSNPRMQMFLWQAPSVYQVETPLPGAAAGLHVDASGAEFGLPLDLAGTTAELVAADDGVAPGSDACEPLAAGSLSGQLALVDRGSCNFTVKVAHAQAAGAVGVVVANNAGDELVTMAGDDPSIVIPSVFVGQSDGAALRAALPTPGTRIAVAALRDGAYDNGVVIHEYAHGITNRLTGGADDVNCLDNVEQMGEGWSDFHTLALTALPSHTRTTPRPIGAYGRYEGTDGVGIRNFPYSTDLAVHPYTYDDTRTTNLPHGLGEVWALMLWEMYWNLVDAYGFDPDLFAGSGGNNLALQLVMDGLKLQPCSPSFTDGRDAILAADLASSGGANQCAIWQAFAKRGLGVSADSGSSDSRADNVEAFDLPVECTPECGNGVDDDGDGLADGDDPGCTDPDDPSERAPELACDDGQDNDGDGRADFDPATFADVPTFAAGFGDPGCKSPTWSLEDPECQDGLDNDPGEDPVPDSRDFDGGASAGASSAGADPQCVDRPWRKNEAQSSGSGCGFGAELVLLLPLLRRLARRRG